MISEKKENCRKLNVRKLQKTECKETAGNHECKKTAGNHEFKKTAGNHEC